MDLLRILEELIKIYALFVSLFFINRVALYRIYFDRLNDISFRESMLAFVYGLRMDTMAICIILIVPVLILSITPTIFSSFGNKLVSNYVLVFLLISLFIESATFPFLAQYDVRPNYLFIEYLKYPKEVSSMILKEYPALLFFTLILMATVAYLYKIYFPVNFEDIINISLYKRVLIFPLLAVLLFIGIRSSFGHRPANISDAIYSSNRMANEIAKNSMYSIGYAYYNNSKENDLTKPYISGKKMELKEAYERVSKRLNIPLDSLNAHPFYRSETTHFKQEQPKNLVIFIQESLGAQFVSFSGGDKTTTPNLERLSKEGITFTNLFSNGTRSVRGLAGLSSGWLPLVGEEVIKRNKSQKEFFTVASLLKPYGYKSSFIYGGEARFDDMKTWYMGNGFDEVIEQKDYTNPSFVSSWGVSDEDLVIKANERFKEYDKKGEKFVSVMFSSSNHSPFELPDGKIEFIEGKERRSVENAVKYADFAIGRFFELAKEEPYYKDTVFVVVADHNVRVYGDDVVPINMFQIPALIISDGIKTQKYDTLSSQPDVLATALDLIGLDLNYPILGKSIFSDDKKEIAFMMFNDTFALREKNRVAVIQPNSVPLSFTYKDKKLLISEQRHTDLEEDIIAFIIVLNDMYDKKLF